MMMWSALVFLVILDVAWVVAGSPSFVPGLPVTLLPIRRNSIHRRSTTQASGIGSLALSDDKQSVYPSYVFGTKFDLLIDPTSL